LLGQTDKTPESDAVERDLTLAHAAAVKTFLKTEDLDAANIRMIGFHGQTITHAPQDGLTWQIGDGALLALETGIDVVNDFRSADVEAGGEGAPLLPLYHRARVRSAGITETVAILNIGGVSNVTWIGRGEDDILAFDTGPGNALIDDTMLNRTGDPFDRNGLLARQGRIDQLMIDLWMDHDFFTRVPPKSLDRNAWKIRSIDALSTVDALATLTAFTVQANIKAKDFFPEPPASWYVAGGGRHNPVIMQSLHTGLGVPVKPVDTLGWNGDMLEAEGFAYLAVRSVLKLPLSLPTTTGVLRPLTGGVYHSASS
jgi:anhydro-N-acetylmuramic acid kinase